MSSLLDTRHGTGAAMRYGEVTDAREGMLRVECEGETLLAEAAVTCLIEPRVGDRVLLAEAGEERYVLAVLRRESPDATLSFAGDVDVKARHGRIRLAGQDGVDLCSGTTVGLSAPCVRLSAETAEVKASATVVQSANVDVTTDQARLAARNVETVVERLYQRLRCLFRRVEETEDVEAGSIIARAKRMLHLKGHFANIVGRKHVRVDGDQVHVG